MESAVSLQKIGKQDRTWMRRKMSGLMPVYLHDAVINRQHKRDSNK